MPRYLIGIDMGTTNSALAYIDLQQKVPEARGREPRRPEIHPFPVPQLVAPGEVGGRELLPSFLYLPGPHDLPVGATALPWDRTNAYAVGEFARNHGARVPGRARASRTESSARQSAPGARSKRECCRAAARGRDPADGA